MKGSIIGIDPKTGKVKMVAEDSKAERKICYMNGWDVLSVSRVVAAKLYGETIIDYEFDIADKE